MLFLHLFQPKFELKLPTFRIFLNLDFITITIAVVTTHVTFMVESRTFLGKRFVLNAE